MGVKIKFSLKICILQYLPRIFPVLGRSNFACPTILGSTASSWPISFQIAALISRPSYLSETERRISLVNDLSQSRRYCSGGEHHEHSESNGQGSPLTECQKFNGKSWFVWRKRVGTFLRDHPQTGLNSEHSYFKLREGRMSAHFLRWDSKWRRTEWNLLEEIHETFPTKNILFFMEWTDENARYYECLSNRIRISQNQIPKSDNVIRLLRNPSQFMYNFYFTILHRKMDLNKKQKSLILNKKKAKEDRTRVKTEKQQKNQRKSRR